MEPENSTDSAKSLILAAALPHAAFDGWSETTLAAALTDSGVAPALGRALYPRGGVDLAVAYHRSGDAAMKATPTTNRNSHHRTVAQTANQKPMF